MRHQLVSQGLTGVALVLLPSTASAARPCNASSGGTFQYRLGDARYDAPDPSDANDLSTIAASLRDDNGTPLYECVAQWPETWRGWYEDGSTPIWADCIFTGAGLGLDETISFAVDWKNKTMFLAQTFACSDETGSEGLAVGSLQLFFNCTTADNTSYCIPVGIGDTVESTIDITTKLVQTPLGEASACSNTSKQYQSWKLDNWLRRIEVQPGTSKLVSDTGPSFTLQSLTDGVLLNCTVSGQQNGSFTGNCQAPNNVTTPTSADFTFDPKLDMLQVTQHWTCGSLHPTASGVMYIQAACERSRNSDQLTCTSDAVWIGTVLDG